MAKQIDERERFERAVRIAFVCSEHSFVRDTYCRYINTVQSHTFGGREQPRWADVQMLWKCWRAATADEADGNAALDLLEVLFTAYEDGCDVYEDPEECSGHLGHAVKLDDATFHACADLLNRKRPRAA